MNREVIIACDFQNREETMAFLARFTERKPFVKIGMELFYGEGPDIVREIRARGHQIFLDLKLHDIPNTVNKAMRNLARLGVDMTNVHAAGTVDMMRAAREGLEDGAQDKAPLLIAASIEDTVAHYARNAQESGLSGVVCSPLEVELVKRACGTGFYTVTPGIRYPDGDAGDQSRITTPQRAREMGSDFIVVGRPITQASDPAVAYARVCADFCN